MSEISSTSELTTKEIVEQAISDYHESILPFLNGQVPTIANKFDKANLYSTDEQIVGRWIDGKPLYQKIVDCGNAPSSSTDNNWWYEFGTNIDFGKLIYCYATLDNSNDTTSIPYNTNSLGNVRVNLYVHENNNVRKGYIGLHTDKDRSHFHIYAIVQYTKTTDEAIAIGSDTDYSTTEKIIGTWIDGKPLYQKTITGTTPADSGELDTGLTNIDFCKLKECIIQGSAGYSLNIACQSTEVDIKTDGTKIYFSYPVGSVFKNSPFYATVQYTKTTD